MAAKTSFIVIEKLFYISFGDLLLVFLSTMGIFIVVITYTRIAGLRSFSKMSSFDFAMTVAVGSIIATIAITQASLIKGIVALAGLYVLQVIIAIFRRFNRFKQLVDNTPTLLMVNGEMLQESMKLSRVTEEDILSKLRESNVANLDSVKAVVLETTGNISVLHSSDEIDHRLFTGVKGSELIKK